MAMFNIGTGKKITLNENETDQPELVKIGTVESFSASGNKARVAQAGQRRRGIVSWVMSSVLNQIIATVVTLTVTGVLFHFAPQIKELIV